MKIFIAALAILISLTGAVSAQPPRSIDVSGLTEASMNFDQSGVGPFLADLSKNFSSGFDQRQAQRLTKAIKGLPVEQTGNWEFTVTANGKTERLVVVAFKGDLDAPDLAFYSSPELAAQIQKRLGSFAQAQGW